MAAAAVVARAKVTNLVRVASVSANRTATERSVAVTVAVEAAEHAKAERFVQQPEHRAIVRRLVRQAQQSA